MASPIIDKLIKEFKKEKLSLEDRNTILNALLGKISALPLRESIEIGPNFVKINRKKLSTDELIAFREGCIVLNDNFARKVINQQIRFLAVNWGINKAVSIDELLIAKAAIWVLNQEEDILKSLVASEE